MIFIYIKHGKCKALTNFKTCSVLGKFKICSYTNKSSIYYNVPNNLFPSMRFLLQYLQTHYYIAKYIYQDIFVSMPCHYGGPNEAFHQCVPLYAN